ncbi:hypothetical protein GALMADRAFT_254207 [Galerina marginata CBS 339.88]|uniref:Ribonuclease H n=1 Tax=Galerina marginata (strain CBS 339.88) TaxID=685588 RepID=A0A067SWB2_GALM3|nr:hypothetical protein GALMADRAFT_254207 [Galerina marginata CBS 339.88]
MPPTRTKAGFYGVKIGRTIGIYTTWTDCEAQTKGYPSAIYKKFPTQDAAEIFVYGTLKRDMTQPQIRPSQSKSSRLEQIRAALASPSSNPRIVPLKAARQVAPSKLSRFEQICAALSPLPAKPQAIPSTSSSPPVTPSLASRKRFEQIHAALSSPGSSPSAPLTVPSSPICSDPNNAPTTEFSRLKPRSAESNAAYNAFTDALTQEFNPTFDTDVVGQPSVLASSRRRPNPPPLKSVSPQLANDGPLSQFFSQHYPSFIHKPNNVPTHEFSRLCWAMDLEPHTDERTEAYDDFTDALTQEFNLTFGTDVDSITSWQALCARIGISPIPETLEECRQVVMSTHVNLVDLTTKSCAIEIFNSVKQLSEYTIDSRKIFPSHSAHAGSLLRFLLRHIFNPERDSGRGRSRKSR